MKFQRISSHSKRCRSLTNSWPIGTNTGRVRPYLDGRHGCVGRRDADWSMMGGGSGGGVDFSLRRSLTCYDGMEPYSAQIDMDRRNLDGREAGVRLSAFMHASTGAGPSRYRSVQQ